jgi:hypothetical protein
VTFYGIGDEGATLAARLLAFPTTTLVLTNALLSPDHHVVWLLPDTGFSMQRLDLWLPGAPLHFPYGQSVPADVPL